MKTTMKRILVTAIICALLLIGGCDSKNEGNSGVYAIDDDAVILEQDHSVGTELSWYAGQLDNDSVDNIFLDGIDTNYYIFDLGGRNLTDIKSEIDELKARNFTRKIMFDRVEKLSKAEGGCFTITKLYSDDELKEIAEYTKPMEQTWNVWYYYANYAVFTEGPCTIVIEKNETI